MEGLDAIGEQMHALLRAKNTARDRALEQSRAVIRYSSLAIRAVHRDERALAEENLRQARTQAKEMQQGLADYPAQAFDYVILSECFQQVKKPELVLAESLRVGKQVIVSFPNFVHYSARWQLFFKGTVPVTPSLPYDWYDTPNLHFLSIKDFQGFCRKRGITIEKSGFVGRGGRAMLFPNLTALVGVFLISKR